MEKCFISISTKYLILKRSIDLKISVSLHFKYHKMKSQPQLGRPLRRFTALPQIWGRVTWHRIRPIRVHDNMNTGQFAASKTAGSTRTQPTSRETTPGKQHWPTRRRDWRILTSDYERLVFIPVIQLNLTAATHGAMRYADGPRWWAGDTPPFLRLRHALGSKQINYIQLILNSPNIKPHRLHT